MVAKRSAKKKRSSVSITASDDTPSRRTSALRYVKRLPKNIYQRVTRRVNGFLSRRPHRSFRRTRRRDYRRSLALPGYVAFTYEVWRMIASHKRTLIGIVFLYGFALFILGGVTSQENFAKIGVAVSEMWGGVAQGEWSPFAQAGLTVGGILLTGPGEVGVDTQIYLSLALVLTWLTTVWLLREIMAGRKPKLRDGIYSSGAPLVSTLILIMFFALQLVPIALLAAVFFGLSAIGALEQGFAWMLFSLISVTVVALVLYWVTATFFALIVVTLPGAYPMHAVKIAGDLMVSRRLRLLYRLLWLMLTIILVWVLVMIPLVMMFNWLAPMFSFLASVPIMPFLVALLSSATVVWAATYIYMLYRKVVDDTSRPA